MRKFIALIVVSTLVCNSCNFNAPLDYYNMAVTAGNTSLGLHEFESRLERLESGMKLDPQDLAATTLTRLPYNEGILEKLNGMLGNKDSDSMIKAAIAYLQFDIDCAKNTKTMELFQVAGNASTFEEVSKGLEPLGDFLDSIYDRREELWSTYDSSITEFAKKNNIEMKIYGPGTPVE